MVRIVKTLADSTWRTGAFIIVIAAAAIATVVNGFGLRVSGGLALFFIIWWTLPFAVLPFGIRSQVEAGEVVKGSEPGAPAAVVISHQAWTQHFGQDPSIVGESVLVAGRPMTVVGVVAAGFFGDTIRPNPAGIWMPLGQEPAHRGPASLIDRLDQDWLYAIGRIRGSVDPAAVASRATASPSNC